MDVTRAGETRPQYPSQFPVSAPIEQNRRITDGLTGEQANTLGTLSACYVARDSQDHENWSMASLRFRLLIAIAGLLAATAGARAQAKFPQDSDNAALRYWTALTEVRSIFDEDEPTQKLLWATAKGEIPWDENKLGPILERNANALRAMQRGAKLPECNWGLDYRLGVSTPVEMVMRARGLELLNTLEGIRELAKGNGQAAVNIWLSGIRFSQDVGRGGPVVLALVASGMLTDTLQPITAQAKQGKLEPAQKKALYEAIKQLPDDGFDWGISWGIEYAIGNQFLEGLRQASDPRAVYKQYGAPVPKGVPPTQQDIDRYGEFMLAVQGALREHPDIATPLLSDLESRERSLREAERWMIPSLSQPNRARIKVLSVRDELLQVLASN